MTAGGAPCFYCGAAGGCSHRDSALPDRSHVKEHVDLREKESGGGGQYRRKRRSE